MKFGDFKFLAKAQMTSPVSGRKAPRLNPLENIITGRQDIKNDLSISIQADTMIPKRRRTLPNQSKKKEKRLMNGFKPFKTIPRFGNLLSITYSIKWGRFFMLEATRPMPSAKQATISTGPGPEMDLESPESDVSWTVITRVALSESPSLSVMVSVAVNVPFVV